MNYKCIILIIGIGFVFSQKVDELSYIPIQGYTVSPNPGKLRIIANYNSFTSPEFFDDDGWPHYKVLDQLPNLKAGEQSVLMKEAIVTYFLEKAYIS